MQGLLNWLEISQRIHQSVTPSSNIMDLDADLREAFKNLGEFKVEAQESNAAYGRNVLYSTPEFEVMLASWRPFIECAPHDHGFSTGTVLILEGLFEEVSYSVMADTGTLVRDPYSVRHGETGQFFEVSGDVFHSMKNLGNVGVTLHFYTPSIKDMRVLDLKNRRTLILEDDCGAWIPADAQKIKGIQTWSQTKIG